MYNTAKPYSGRLLDIIKTTWETPYLTLDRSLYTTYRINSPFNTQVMIDHTDGIGTKGFYHWHRRTWSEAAIDAIAMNVNDLLMARARPIKAEVHISLPAENEDAVFGVTETLAAYCRNHDIALTGGETSIMNTSTALDVSLTMTGITHEPSTPEFRPGDVLLGIPSTGFHANGFSLVRFVLGDEAVTIPTAVYWDRLWPYIRRARGMMHITGGAYTKFKPWIGQANLRFYRLNFRPQVEFYQMYQGGVTDLEMYRTFNCGVGFILSVDPGNVEDILNDLPDVIVIGVVEEGDGKVIIESAFSDTEVVL